MRSLLISIILAAAAANAQEAPDFGGKKVTFQSKAMQVSAVLEDLARVAEVPISGSPSLAREFVYVSVKDASLKELLSRLSDICSGEWKQTSQGWTLSRSGSKALADEKAEVAAKLKILQAALEKSTKSASDALTSEKVESAFQRIEELQKKMQDKPRGDDTLYRESAKLAKLSPVERARARLVQCIDLSAIAAMKGGDRLVFSSNPTRMQLRMTGRVSEILRQFSQEYAIWNEVALRRPVSDEGDSWMPYNDMNYRMPIKYPPAKAIYICSMGMNFGRSVPQLTLIIYDTRGKVIMQSNGLSDYDEEDDPFNAMKSAPAVENDQPAEFGKLTNELVSLITRFSSSRPDVGLSSEWLERLLDPVKFDPLSLTATEVLDHISKVKQQNIVAVVPDSMYLPMFAVSGSKPTTSVLLHMMRTVNRLNIDEKDGWMTIRPKFPVQARLSRSDRALSKKIIRSIMETGRLSIEEIAEYAAVSEPPSEESTMLMSLFMLSLNKPEIMGTLSSMFSNGNWTALKLYGRLGESQRKHLLGGGSIAYNALTPPQKEMFFKLVYGADSSLSTAGEVQGTETVAPAVVDTVPVPDQQELAPPEFDRGSFESEPTEALPNGIPSDAYLTISGSLKEVLFARDSSRPDRIYEYPQELESIAWNLFSRERPDLFPPDPEQMNFDLFRVASQRQVEIKANLTPKLSVVENLSEILENKRQYVPLKDLPGTMRKRIEDAMEQYRRTYKDVKEGGGGEIPPGESGEPPPRL